LRSTRLPPEALRLGRGHLTDRTYEFTGAQGAAACNCGAGRRGHVGTLPGHPFRPNTQRHPAFFGAGRRNRGHRLLRRGGHFLPTRQDDARPNEAAIGILPGELWHLRSHPEPDVCRLAARSHCIGDLSFLALDVGRAGGILSLHRAFSNRTRGARAHRFIRHRVHGVSIQGSPVALRPNTATAHADAGRRRFAS